MSHHLLVVGSLNLDLTAYTTRLPNMGETILGSDFRTFPGGKGANQAVAAARLGAQVSMVGKVGADDFGKSLIENLEKNGVDAACVFRDEQHPTGTALITVDENGRNTIVVISGSNYALQPQDIRRCEERIAAADVLLLQLETPLETVFEAAKLAHQHGVRVLLTPAPARVLPQELFSLVDVLLPNETEASVLTGLPVTNDSEIAAAAQALRGMGAGSVLITCGKRGAYFMDANTQMFIDAFPVQSVDSTAAGDAFTGGFGTALAEGLPLAEALRWGSAAGALSVTRRGAQSALPTRAELEQFLAEH